MANEEIQVTMGLNTSSFRTELEKAKSATSSFASAVKEPFSSLKAQIGGLFAGLATIEAVRKVSDFAENIKRTAEITGLSTDQIQGFNYGVKQTGGDVQGADTALERLNKTLGEALQGLPEGVLAFHEMGISLTDASGNAKDANEVLREVADKIKNAKSESERAAIAFEAFGKSGQELIPFLLGGADGLDKFTDSASKLSEKNIEDIVRFKKSMDDSATTAEVWGGKVVGALATVSRRAGLLFFGGTKALGSDLADAETGSGDYAKKKKLATTVPDITTTDAYKKAMNALHKAEIDANDSVSEEAKYGDLFQRRADLMKEIAGMEGDSVEKVQKQTELAKVVADLNKTKNELESKTIKEREEADQKHAQSVKAETEKKDKTAAMQKEYDTLERKKSHEDFEESQRGSQYASLEEVAQFRGGRFQRIAQTILRENLDQKYARLKGNFGRAENDRQDANAKMDYLAAQGVIDPKDYEAHQAAEAQKDTAESIKTLLDKATNEGINIKPVMAP